MAFGPNVRQIKAHSYDVARKLLLGDVTLKFFEKKTDPPTLLAEVRDGWLPSSERIRGQIETLFKVEVVDQSLLTSNVTSRANRLQWGNNYCKIDSQDPPQGEPRTWTFFTKEVKTGAIK